MVALVVLFLTQDHNESIENDELHGFLKDLMELVQEVSYISRTISLL